MTSRRVRLDVKQTNKKKKKDGYVLAGTVSAPQGDIEGRPIFNVGINWCTAMVEAFKVVSKGSPLQRGCAETKPVIPRRKAKKKAKPEANVMDVDCRV